MEERKKEQYRVETSRHEFHPNPPPIHDRSALYDASYSQILDEGQLVHEAPQGFQTNNANHLLTMKGTRGIIKNPLKPLNKRTESALNVISAEGHIDLSNREEPEIPK